MLKNILKSTPFLILITLIVAFYSDSWMNLSTKQFFLGMSMSIKEILMFMIPWLIFSTCFMGVSKIRHQALYLMVALLVCIICSNFFSVMMAGGFSYFAVFGADAVLQEIVNVNKLTPLWEYPLPKLIPNYVALILAVACACISNLKFVRVMTPLVGFISKVVDVFLSRFFIPLLPVFIFGFVLKLLHDDIMSDLHCFNPRALICMIILLFSYLSLLFCACVICGRSPIDLLKTLVPPGITAFITMSSAAALPFSLKASQINTGKKEISDIVMPIASNVHMIGDALCIPIMAMILLVSFGFPPPNLWAYLCFTGLFTVTKFSGSGVPGGSMLVMIPVLESTLGFTGEMTALIAVFYMLIDPITSLGNVLGNNLCIILFSRFINFTLSISSRG